MSLGTKSLSHRLPIAKATFPVGGEPLETDVPAGAAARDSKLLENERCWKCRGIGKKFRKESRAYDGDPCRVCSGTGSRQPSKKARDQERMPGQVVRLRGKNGVFVGPRAVGGLGVTAEEEDATCLASWVGPGEIMGALGCGDWRIFQLANGHKLTVDDFLVAWVAAEEMRKRGFGPRRGRFGLTDPQGETASSFSHADIGCGCGSVLMTVAWAFPGTVKSYGVEAQETSFELLKRGLRWNLGIDGSDPKGHDVCIVHDDLRTWDGGERAPYDLITGTPPYFPKDHFVASQNAAQKVRCRVPTRGAASDYIRCVSRLLAPKGVACIVETSRKEGEQAILDTLGELLHSTTPLQVQRRLDVITREGLPPRFSIWVLERSSTGKLFPAESEKLAKRFPVSTFTLRNRNLHRTLEYVEAMETMGWVDFMNTREQLAHA